ncbi:MAG: permease-like cell division protein FtsX [Bacilli bacterium]|nr:permease-like cell division protein FtsX [Bacilli bacterium]
MKVIRIIRRSMRDSLKSVFRNITLSMASIVCTTITLILVAIAIIVLSNVNNFAKELESNLTIVVFVNKDATQENINTIENNIKVMSNIESYTYISKDDIKAEMMNESDIFNEIMGSWDADKNPLQDEFNIKVKDVTKLSDTANELKQMENISFVKYGEAIVDKVVKTFGYVEKGSIAVVIALVFVTVFLVSNTIRLTIFSRRSEIEIMRLVGTSNFAIKLPFFFEGLIIGVLGSLIPIILAVYGYIVGYNELGGHFYTNVVTLIKPMPFVFYLAIFLVAIGAIVGMLGSTRSVRKYLKI